MKATRHVVQEGWLSRERALALLLIVASGIVFYLFYRLLLPFLPALAWALALAVIAHPMHRWISRRVPYRSISAGIACGIVTLVIIAPVVFVTDQMVREAGKYTTIVQEELVTGKWRERFEKYPRMKPALSWIETQLGLAQSKESSSDPSKSARDATKSPDQDGPVTDGEDTGASSDPLLPDSENSDAGSASRNDRSEQDSQDQQAEGGGGVEGAASMITQGVSSVVTGTIWVFTQLLITIMTLFFFFRDRHLVLNGLRSIMPLSDTETTELFERVDDTIHATIYGSVVVGMVQGTLGGLMFWALGLPSPLTWGVVMGVLAVVPVLGTFVIWGPTALVLAFQGEWGKALAMVAFGGLAIGLIDNLLYPFLVGKRLRFHTLLVFFALVGGIALLGASGIILGPLILALADALLHVWQSRTAFGGTVEEGVDAA